MQEEFPSHAKPIFEQLGTLNFALAPSPDSGFASCFGCYATIGYGILGCTSVGRGCEASGGRNSG